MCKNYFNKYHRFHKGGDYYGNDNWVLNSGLIEFKNKYDGYDDKIFISNKSCKNQCYIEFITQIKTDKEMQKWYIKKYSDWKEKNEQNN